MAKYVRQNRHEKLEMKRQKKENEALRFALDPVADPVIEETPPVAPQTTSIAFVEPFEKKFEALSRAFRQSLATAQKVHEHIEQLPDESYREKLHHETRELTNNILADLIAELDALSKTVPPEATTLRKTLQAYREPFMNLISPPVEPEQSHVAKPSLS